ncbi:MAG TPA: hypothetical protein VLD36_12910 [Burkholderiales bacterium]|nr:hypothetical protein [Burkholderiales bacterium]
MIENTTERAAGQKSPGVTPRASPMAMCPMARMCARMMEKPHSGSLLMLPGALLIALGVLIFLEPRIVVWLVGIVAVLMGIMFFMMARFIGRLRKPSF